MSAYTKRKGFEAVASSLRDFGYPDANWKMVHETWLAMQAKKKTMPHGVIGMFAKSQLEEVMEKFVNLPDGELK